MDMDHQLVISLNVRATALVSLEDHIAAVHRTAIKKAMIPELDHE